VLAAAGYENGKLRLWHLQSAPTVLTEDWQLFLEQLDGTALRIVTDGHSGTIKAVQNLWPSTERWRSEWHFKKALYDYLRKAKLHGDTRVMRALQTAFASRYQWDNFVAIAYKTGLPDLRDWLNDYSELVDYQLVHRPLEADRAINPLSIGGLDRSKLDKLKEWIEPRATGFLNRQRMDRLLMLMQLELNGLADEAAYAQSIREWLITNAGRPAVERRAVTDHDGPSLLSEPARKLHDEKMKARAELKTKRRR